MSTKKIVTNRRVSIKKKMSDEWSSTEAQTIPLLLYRRLALLFVVIVATVLIAVLYLATMQAVIHVSVTPQTITADFIVRTAQTATMDGEVEGEIHAGTLGKTETFFPSADSTKDVEEKATGVVTLKNTSTSAQPLVATTRLLAKNGVLFRLVSGVTVPAGGTIEAKVQADQKGESGNIEATSFTIPGLNEAKQKLITGTSVSAMTSGVKKISVLSQQDIDGSIESLKSALLEDAKGMLRQQTIKTHTGETFFVDARKTTVSAKAGEEVTSFDVTLEVLVSGVFYDDEALKKITTRKLSEGLGQGQEFMNQGDDAREVTVSSVNAGQKVANIHVRQSATATISPASPVLDVGQFVGLSEKEVRELLISANIAKEVSVDFFPFWVRTVPRLKDHIYIDIR